MKTLDNNQSTSSFEHLNAKYGTLMTTKDVAEALKYPTAEAVRAALRRKKLALEIMRLPNRREFFIRTLDVAEFIDNLP